MENQIMLQKAIIILGILGLSCAAFGQEWAIEQYRLSDGKTHRIGVGDKVLISFDQLATEAINRPSDVFVSQPDSGKTSITLKARITGITATTIQFKDRSMHGQREIRIDKITGMRRLSTGKQLLRTGGQGLGYLSIGMAAVSATYNLWSALTFMVGGFSLIAITTDEFHPKYQKDWRIRVVEANSKHN